MLRSTLFVSLLVFAGFLAGRTAPVHLIEPLAEAGASQDQLCAGGPQGWLSISLEPTMAEGGLRVERFELGISTSQPTARLRYAIEFFGDRGAALAAPAISDILFQPETGEQRFSLSPPEVADGYYLVRATVVGANAEGDASEIAEVYVHVVDGLHLALTAAEWHSESGANLAIE